MQVAIHAGAAFTDEGHLLQTLTANKDALGEHKVAPLAGRQNRQFVKIMSDALAQDAPAQNVQAELQDTLPNKPGIERVIMSNDKTFGPRRTALLNGQIYPFAGQRIAYTQEILGDMQIELFVGLSNPAFFVPKVLMSLHTEIRQGILNTTDLSCLSWLSMIEDLSDLAPGIAITLWPNEDTPLIWGDIIRAISGLPANVPMMDEHALLASLLTETGKRELATRLQHPKAIVPRDVLKQIFENHAQPDLIEEEVELPGWTSDIVEAFTEIYEQDLAKIRTLPNVHLLEA